MSIIDNLHNAILAGITSSIAGIGTYGSYPKVREVVITPAIFLDMVSMDMGNDPGTGQLAVLARFQARVIIKSSDNSQMQVRNLAAEIARVVYNQSFGQNVTPAKIVSIGSDGFSPELDAYDIWLVEWEHEFHLGESVWDGDAVLPDKIFLGFSPEVGFSHENDYEQIETIQYFI